MPKSKHHDLDFIVDQLDWDKNVDPNFRDHHYLEPVPVADTRTEGFVDRWIVYAKVDGEQLFTAKELTEDEYFCTEDGAKNGVTFENTSDTEPLVTLRYFGPEVNPDAPAMGAYWENRF